MSKSKSLWFLIVFVIALLIIITIENLGYMPQYVIDFKGFKANEFSEKILGFFASISSWYYLVLVCVLLCALPTVRDLGRIMALQLIVTFVFEMIILAFEKSGYSLFSTFSISQNDLLILYAFFVMLMLNLKVSVDSLFLRILIRFAITLFVFLATVGNLYFVNITVSVYIVSILLSVVITAISYLVIDVRKYYFL